MSNFKHIKSAIQTKFNTMSNKNLFIVDVDPNELWELYLRSFPEGTNPIYKERTEHDCQCCRNFIKKFGGLVAIEDNKLISIWDVNVGGHYQLVADALASFIKRSPIQKVFFTDNAFCGTDSNKQIISSDSILTWEHFSVKLPSAYVVPKTTLNIKIAEISTKQKLLKRALTEITVEAIQTILELIDQNSLYRGQEFKPLVTALLGYKQVFDTLEPEMLDNFCWSKAFDKEAGIKNTIIGTLLVDLSRGISLDDAVKMFESKVAPTNYKRPTALITKGMIAKAEQECKELGIEKSLIRRYAVIDDITINNVLFADRSVKQEKGVFDILEPHVDMGKLSKIEEVTINTFIESILPKADTIELLVENNHVVNLVSLIAPQHEEAKSIFKWGNNFSWAYNGEVTDSIKEKVKRAGGNVEGALRCSLSWNNYDDLDIHIKEPTGNHIYYGNRHYKNSGVLDVDMNVHATTRSPVENVVWEEQNIIKDKEYKVWVNNFSPREAIDVGFTVELEFKGVVTQFHYEKQVKKDVEVVNFKVKEQQLEIIESLPTKQAPQEIWGIKTQQFHKVKLALYSPNCWNDRVIGNKHYFFILDKCVNTKETRGFFNEFLNNGLNSHRKVFEVLGSKMKVPVSNNQLSGLGFSETQRNSVYCRVSGSFTRVIKINF